MNDLGPPINVRVVFDVTGAVVAGTWRPNGAERQAAWEMCVEFATRITLVPLREGEGLLTEALSSLHAIFGETRSILRRGGPALAAERLGELSFAVLTGHLLNQLLRPVTAYWHPRLKAHMDSRPSDRSDFDWEREWPDAQTLRDLLELLRAPLTAFADIFAQACDAQEFLRIQVDNETRLFDQNVRDRAQKNAQAS